MPGIVGIISPRPAAVCQRLVEAMLDSMKHERFYSSATYWVPEKGIYTGSMLINSHRNDQIIFNERKDVVLVLSGECFFDSRVGSELRREGHQVGKSRASWLPHLYEEKGEPFIQDLNGLFSGLLIDNKQRRVLLFNDRYGSERIYYHEANDSIYFASEAKALLRILPELREFDQDGVAQFLRYGCTFGGRTLFKGIQLLPAASIWSFENARCQKRKYFSPTDWEAQSVLSAEEFTGKFQATFNRILSQYFESEARIGISLTGGLDTRMIMACRPDGVEAPICYTFTGKNGETLDDRIAHRVTTVCGLEHRLLRLGSDFLDDFSSHADRTVYITDGCCGVTGAHEIYLNQQARLLAPVRLTGNYGSEVLRGVSTFKPVRYSPALFDSRFNRALNSSAKSFSNRDENAITFAAFREIPWHLFGTLAAARSQVTLRTPYLDNEIVALAYQAPESLRRSSLPAWGLVRANSPSLGKIPTDRRPSPEGSRSAAMARRLFSEITFKLDYLNNEGWPNWLSPFEPIVGRVASTLKIIGLHKYLHYRSWFRRELAEYLKSVVNDSETQQCQPWNRDFLRRMANEHIKGRKNYVREINAVLTLEAVDRLLIRGPAFRPGGRASVSFQSAAV